MTVNAASSVTGPSLASLQQQLRTDARALAAHQAANGTPTISPSIAADLLAVQSDVAAIQLSQLHAASQRLSKADSTAYLPAKIKAAITPVDDSSGVDFYA